MAVLVSLVLTATMIAAGGVPAWLVYCHLDLRLVSRNWFNLETWSVGFVLVGAICAMLTDSKPRIAMSRYRFALDDQSRAQLSIYSCNQTAHLPGAAPAPIAV